LFPAPVPALALAALADAADASNVTSRDNANSSSIVGAGNTLFVFIVATTVERCRLR